MTESNQPNNSTLIYSDWALKLQLDAAVQKEKLESIDKKLDGFIIELKTAYASKQEVRDLRESFDNMKANINWIVKIVLGAVVVALLGLIIVKGGMPHP